MKKRLAVMLLLVFALAALMAPVALAGEEDIPGSSVSPSHLMGKRTSPDLQFPSQS